jgi:ubiquinone/menaquinone biosynthesis C-methylase UbiE
MDALYKNPDYYKIAFSDVFERDIPTQADIMEKAIEQYSLVPVKTLLEICCGNSMHIPEFLKRGYKCIGIDLSADMVNSQIEECDRLGQDVRIHQADMMNFELDQKVDFAYLLLDGTFFKNNSEIISHFDSVSRVLPKGALYFLEVYFPFNISQYLHNNYSFNKHWNGIDIAVDWTAKMVNFYEQTFEDEVIVRINNRGKTETIAETCVTRRLFPQEFLLFLELRKDFEFIGWWNNWDLACPITSDTNHVRNPITIIRKI